MRASSCALITLAALLPMSVENPAATDSAATDGERTRVAALGGIGRYAIIDRGCEGQILRETPVHIRDAGVQAEHAFDNGLTMGVRGGTIHQKIEAGEGVSNDPYDPDTVVIQHTNLSYVNPWVGFEGRGAGMGVGIITSDDPLASGQRVNPSLHLRLGSRERAYFLIQYLEDVPLYTGGGSVLLGIGVHPGQPVDLLTGIAGGDPYDGAGLALRLEYRVLPHWALTTHGRVGMGDGSENAIAAGLTWDSRLRPPLEPSRRREHRGKGAPPGTGRLAEPEERVEPEPSPSPPDTARQKPD